LPGYPATVSKNILIYTYTKKDTQLITVKSGGEFTLMLFAGSERIEKRITKETQQFAILFDKKNSNGQ
jgi:hypothetical protein